MSPRQAVKNAGKLLKAGAHAVKLEGGERMADAIAACVASRHPGDGHIVLTPQSVHRMGGFKVQRVWTSCSPTPTAVEQAGAFSMVVEGVPTDLGRR